MNVMNGIVNLDTSPNAFKMQKFILTINYVDTSIERNCKTGFHTYLIYI